MGSRLRGGFVHDSRVPHHVLLFLRYDDARSCAAKLLPADRRSPLLSVGVSVSRGGAWDVRDFGGRVALENTGRRSRDLLANFLQLMLSRIYGKEGRRRIFISLAAKTQ